jgi:hypothetical protein
VLLSVDIGYGDTYASAKRDAEQIMKQYKVDWPSVIEPEGWKGVNRRFNVDGYQLILVGPDGKVFSPDARAEDLESLLAKVLKTR